MFDRIKIHYYIVLLWILAFITLCIILNAMMPKKDFNTTLDKVEKNIKLKDWKSAEENINFLEKSWKNHKLQIQINNGSKDMFDFETNMGQLKLAIESKNADGIEYIGALRKLSTGITSIFPGP